MFGVASLAATCVRADAIPAFSSIGVIAGRPEVDPRKIDRFLKRLETVDVRSIARACLCTPATHADAVRRMHDAPDVDMIWIAMKRDVRMRYFGTVPPIKALAIRSMIVATSRTRNGKCETELFLSSTVRERSSIPKSPGQARILGWGAVGIDGLLFESFIAPGDPAELKHDCMTETRAPNRSSDFHTS